MKRVGLFGGTFDPPHLGHVAAISVAWQSGLFDHVLVTVAGDPYEKSNDRAVSPATERLAMAHAAFGDLEGVEVSDREIQRSGPTYTIDTARELCAEGCTVELLVGADAADRIDQWRDAGTLATIVTVGIFPRDDRVVQLATRWRSHIFEMTPVDLSSSRLRDLDPSDPAVTASLPAAVLPLFRRASR